MPDLADAARTDRRFLVRAVRHLAGEVGIRQLLDIGTGLPTANNTHEVAQATAPECRIVYVDNAPLIMAYVRALLGSSPQGSTDKFMPICAILNYPSGSRLDSRLQPTGRAYAAGYSKPHHGQ